MIDREFDVRAYDQGVRDGRAESATEIERLRAEVQVWINHTKTAVWSDSEECKLLTEENAKLRDVIEELEERISGDYEWIMKLTILCDEREEEIGRLRAALRLIAEHPVEQSRQWEVGAREMLKLARNTLEHTHDR